MEMELEDWKVRMKEREKSIELERRAQGQSQANWKKGGKVRYACWKDE